MQISFLFLLSALMALQDKVAGEKEPRWTQGKDQHPESDIMVQEDEELDYDKKHFAKLALAVTGIESSHEFHKIVNAKQYVDKSLFLYWFFSQGSSMYITAPPKFGKSTLLYMVKDFAQARFQPDGTQMTRNTTEEYMLFNGPKPFLGRNNGLSYPVFRKSHFDMHFQNYFVVHLNFGQLTTAQNSYEFNTTLSGILSEAIKSFSKLPVPNQTVCNDLRSLIAKYRDVNHKNPTVFENLNALVHLINEFQDCYNKTTILLGDEYDAPLHAVLMQEEVPQVEVNKFISVMQTVMGTLDKHTKNVAQTLCFGGLNLGGLVSVFSNTIDHYDFFAHEFVPDFVGLKERELKRLLKRYNLESWLEQLNFYYDGYRVLTWKIKRYNLYNLGSVLLSIRKGWVGEVFYGVGRWHSIFDNAFSNCIFGEKIFRAVMMDQSLQIEFFFRGTLYKTIVRLRNKLEQPVEKGQYGLSGREVNYILQYFLEAGYFSVISGLDGFQGNRTTTFVQIVATNFETKLALSKQLYASDFYEFYYGTTLSKRNEFGTSVNELNATDVVSFGRLLKAVCNLTTVNLDREIHFQIPVYYNAFKLISENYFLAGDAELPIRRPKFGGKRDKEKKNSVFDLAIVSEKHVGIIIELELNKTSVDGLYQILIDEHYLAFKFGRFDETEVKDEFYIGLRCHETPKGKMCDMCYLTGGNKNLTHATIVTYPKDETLAAKLQKRKAKLALKLQDELDKKEEKKLKK